MELRELVKEANELGFEEVTYVGSDADVMHLNLAIIQKWLREALTIYVYVKPRQVINKLVWVNNIQERNIAESVITSHSEWDIYHDTYEKALFKGIQLSFDFIKKGGNEQT